MRKLILIISAIMVVTLASCEKISSKKATSYTLIEKTGGYDMLVNGAPAGTEVEYTYFINEYSNDGIRVAMNAVDKPIVGKKYNFVAQEETRYVTVKWQYSLTLGSKEVSEVRYITNAFMLKEGEDTEIIISNETYFQKTEPK
jgi:hypothetical protein